MLKLYGRGRLCVRLAACAAFAVSPLFLAWPPATGCAAADNAPLSNDNQPQSDEPALQQDPKIAAAIRDLGSDDFNAREQAGNFLWSLGEKAGPALRAAAESDDPEVARRAKALLANFALGLRVDTPKAVSDLLNAYRQAREQDEKREIADELSKKGTPGVRVLMELARTEPDDSMRRVLEKDLASVSRETAAQSIASGNPADLDLAGELLEAAADSSESAARDRAVFVTLRGGAQDEISKMKSRLAPLPARPGAPEGPIHSDPPAAAMRLAYLYRAMGDLPNALKFAIRAGSSGAPAGAGAPAADGPQSTTLADAVRIESGDWKGLAADLEHRPNTDGSVESLGFVAAYYRLAGDSAALDKWAGKLVEYADQNPNDNWDAASALLLNDKTTEAIDVLKRHKNYSAAMEFLAPRLEFPAMLEMLQQAHLENSPDMPRLRSLAAEGLHFVGKSAEARASLQAVARGDEGVLDGSSYPVLIEAAHEAGIPQEEIDAWCVQDLEAYWPRNPGDADPRPILLEKAGFGRPEDALKWWPILRARHPGDSAVATFHQLRMLDANRWPGADLDLFAGEMQAEAGTLPEAGRDERLLLVAQTLAAAGHTDSAARAFEALERVTNDPADLLKAADFEAGQKHWDRAAGLYARVVAAEQDQPTPLYLWGWVVCEQGKASNNAKMEQEGRDRMAHADLMALGDESARHTLAEAMAQHHLTDEVKRERDLIVQSGEFGSREVADTLRQAGDDANAAGDFLNAASLWDRSFLANLSTRFSFTDPSANLLVPAMVHRARATGLFRAGRLAEGMTEAETCYRICPGDADGQIALVTELQDHGHRSEADAVYTRALAFYAGLHSTYPDSGPANNLVAWFEGRCHRDLNEALTLAQKAVDLEPSNAGIIDTLAEVHFQRGEFDAAIALTHKCMDMEPGFKHYRDNLERFTKAKQGVKMTG